VSQLTDFYLTHIQEIFVEQGIQPLTIVTCDKQGEVLPFTIGIQPVSLTNDYSKYTHIAVDVIFSGVSGNKLSSRVIFHSELHRDGMTVRNIYQCALHVAGDFIKFYTKGS